MTDILNRVELHTPEQGHKAVATHLWPWARQQLEQGRPLVVEARLLDDDITNKQRAYLHAVVLTEIALYARPNGQSFPMPVFCWALIMARSESAWLFRIVIRNSQVHFTIISGRGLRGILASSRH